MSLEKLSTETKASEKQTTGQTAGSQTTWRGQALQLLAIVLAVFHAKGAIAEPFYVPSGSMEPTLLIGDALLASKYPYGYSAASLPIQITLPETGRVLGGVAGVQATLTPDGVVRHLAPLAFVKFGELDGQVSERVLALKAAFERTRLAGALPEPAAVGQGAPAERTYEPPDASSAAVEPRCLKARPSRLR